MKVYKKPEDIIGADFYLTPSKEKVFLEKLKNLGAKVRVPKVYVSYENGDAGYDFLMMESLPAVSIDDVLQGRAELPKNFDLASFRDDLNDFVERMHSENIYHRDLHEGNIMIDKETCQPYVIDFGAAAEFYGQIEIGERGPYHITKDGREIILTSDEAMVRSIVKKINGMLTRTH
jgi:serine/threonine protein kinase